MRKMLVAYFDVNIVWKTIRELKDRSDEWSGRPQHSNTVLIQLCP